MLRAMDNELLGGAACAGSDLTARLLGELARASDCLALAEARVHGAVVAGTEPSGRMRADVRSCRHHVNSLRHVLAGMPSFEGGSRAASA
jgi:hypothetical protein